MTKCALINEKQKKHFSQKIQVNIHIR